MRNRILITVSFIITVLVFSFCGCKKHTNKPAVEQLPAATQYGANTFGCLVNGKVFIPKAKFGNMSPILTCYYQYIDPSSPSGYVFQVKGNDFSDLSVLYSIYINFNSIELEEGKMYQLRESVIGSATGNYRKFTDTSMDDYFTYSPSSGELTITKFDETYQIVSGTFWFTAVNTGGDTVKVTDGRFDMKFTR